MKSYGIPMVIAFLCSVVGAKAETQPVTALSDGIAAFICDEIDNKNDVPLIFVNVGDNWSLSDTPQLSVSKIENGFKFKSSGDEEGFGFLKKISRTQWNFEYLDQKGFYETSCIPQDYFVDLLIEHISPKIIEKVLKKLEVNKENDLNKFLSEYFERLAANGFDDFTLNDAGDGLVFSSEILFSIGSADLSSLGKAEISKVVYIIDLISDEIPKGIDWILRVDGHTDRVPFIGFGKEYKDNWELSQARALSVVRYLMDDLDIPANRLAANGFGEFQPIDDRDTHNAYKTNRRIELKFTEK